jgi:hypothetical protein
MASTAVITTAYNCANNDNIVQSGNHDIVKVAVYDLVCKTQGPVLLLCFVVSSNSSLPSSTGNLKYSHCDCGVLGDEMTVVSELQLRCLINLPSTDTPKLDKHFVVLKGNVEVPTRLELTNNLATTFDHHFPSRVLYNYICPKSRNQETKLLNQLSTFVFNVCGGKELL